MPRRRSRAAAATTAAAVAAAAGAAAAAAAAAEAAATAAAAAEAAAAAAEAADRRRRRRSRRDHRRRRRRSRRRRRRSRRDHRRPAAAEATATAAAAAEAAATAAATAATRTIFGFVHAQRTPAEHGAIELRDGRLGRLVRPHGHEREAACAARLAIDHQVHVTDFAHTFERRTHVVCRRAERQVSHIQSLTHVALSLPAPSHAFVPDPKSTLRTGALPERRATSVCTVYLRARLHPRVALLSPRASEERAWCP